MKEKPVFLFDKMNVENLFFPDNELVL